MEKDRPRVLCVDDEVLVLDGLRRALGDRFHVWTASSGKEALQILCDEGPFLVVVSDMRMPDMNGASLLERVSQLSPATERIMLTGETDRRSALSAINVARVSRLLMKPVSATQLVVELEAAVSRQRALQQQRAELADKLRTMGRRVASIQRRAATGTLTEAIAHELSNILSVVSCTSTMIAERAAAGLPPEDEDLAQLRLVTAHLARHVQSLRGLNATPTGSCTALDLRAVVTETLAMLRNIGVLKRAFVQVEAPARPIMINADRIALEQVVINVVKNAVDAMEGTGRAPRLRVHVGSSEGQVEVSVEDNGCGIAPGASARVFDPYYTTKAPDRGTGLGLSVTRQLVREMGGTVELNSALDVGTRVRIVLPCSGGAMQLLDSALEAL